MLFIGCVLRFKAQNTVLQGKIVHGGNIHASKEESCQEKKETLTPGEFVPVIRSSKKPAGRSTFPGAFSLLRILRAEVPNLQSGVVPKAQ